MRKYSETSYVPSEDGDDNALEVLRNEFNRPGNITFAMEDYISSHRQRCMAGLDALVRKGGLPSGVCFGYERTAKPGFPVKHPAQTKAVRRAFKLGVALSARQAARVLETEGHVSPNGTVHWTAQMVQSIWNRVTYTGRIQYRKTRSARINLIGRRNLYLRGAEDQVTAFNPSLQIVKEEQFVAVRKARRRRQRKARLAV